MPVEILLWSGASLLLILGVVGLVFPAIPGPPLMWVGMLLAAWAERLQSKKETNLDKKIRKN